MSQKDRIQDVAPLQLSARPELQNNITDYVTSATKGILGAAPFAGSLFAELAGVLIPNQRLDRITKFATNLEKRLAVLDKEFVRSKLTDENFSDLMEEGLRQAARSLSDERREYIAAVLSNSLSLETIQFVEAKHLLKILGEISDIEVIWLRSYQVRELGGDSEFREKHELVLKRAVAFIGCSEAELDKNALQTSYREHLVSLGLLERRYEFDNTTKTPRYDSFSGGPKIQGYELTTFGMLLLKQIGFPTKSQN